jgi:hypothetical protein
MHLARREGTLHIVWTNRGQLGEPRYNIVFADSALSQGAMKLREIVGEESLRNYLTTKVIMRAAALNLALRSLRTEGNAAIFHTILSDEQLLSLGLK